MIIVLSFWIVYRKKSHNAGNEGAFHTRRSSGKPSPAASLPLFVLRPHILLDARRMGRLSIPRDTASLAGLSRFLDEFVGK